MTNGSRFAVSAAALCLAACTPREHLGDATDAATMTDAVDDTSADGGAPDRADDSVDLGPPCVIGGTSADLPITVGCAQAPPGRIVIGGDHVYWTVQAAGAIVVRALLAGGGPEPLVYDNAPAVGLVVDAAFAYYTQPSPGRIMRIPLAGGAPVALATKLDAPLFLASDGASLYWTGGSTDGTVMKLDLAPDAKPVTLIDGQKKPRAIAVQDGFVYWTDFADGTILRAADHLTGPADAGVLTANRLASGLVGPSDLVLVGGYAYAPDKAGHIRRVPLGGGDLETFADVPGTPFGIATDGVSIYWSTLGADGGIFSAPPAMGFPIGGQDDPHALAATTDNVYWATWGGRPAVHRFAK
jgi:hypothetical protein